MMRIVPAILFFLSVSLAIPAQAVLVDDAITYSRTNIVIMHSGDEQRAPAPLPWQTNVSPENSSGVVFDVEIRDAMVLYNQRGWYNLSGPNEKSGVMLLFSDPGIAPLSASSQYAPLDVLMIDKEGNIVQIIPNLMMSELEQDILPQQPVRAFLFLKGGMCQQMQIKPGDYVLYKLFRRSPTVLMAPPPAEGAQPSQPQAPMKPMLTRPAPDNLKGVLPTPQSDTEIPREQPANHVDESLEPQPIKRRPPSALLVPVQ
jgi:hypothetical protein